MNKFEKLSKLCGEISELESRVRKAAQDEFKPALKETIAVLREYVPQVTGIRWQQYTPYFNDGDVCEFTMGELEFTYSDGKDKFDYGECWDPVKKVLSLKNKVEF